MNRRGHTVTDKDVVTWSFDGREIRLSHEDLDLAVKHTWSDYQSGAYVKTTINYKAQFLHRIVASRMGLSTDHCIGAKDGSYYNATRENLYQRNYKVARVAKPTCIT